MGKDTMTLAATAGDTDACLWATGSTLGPGRDECWLDLLCRCRWAWDYGARQSLSDLGASALHELYVSDYRVTSDLDVEVPIVVYVGPKSRRRVALSVVSRVRPGPQAILP